MRVILGLDAPDVGEALVGGRPYPELTHPMRFLGSLLDAGALQPSRSARNHLLWLAYSQGLPASRVCDVIEQSGLTSVAKRKAGGFSLGMRQRLGIARCLLSDPELLILDEPMNGLDPGGMLDMRRMIRALVEDEDRTVFVSSHLLDEVEKTCDVAAIIDGGRVIAQGSIEELVADEAGELVIECDDTDRALALLAADPTVRQLRAEHGVLRMNLLAHDQAGEINSRLVGAGMVVTRLEPARRSLEDRFLEMTTRLEVAA
jgi:ABC-2 type transport system ATP-binding protein